MYILVSFSFILFLRIVVFIKLLLKLIVYLFLCLFVVNSSVLLTRVGVNTLYQLQIHFFKESIQIQI